MVQAGETATSVPYDDNVGRILKTIGQPLELVNLGQSKASLRLDSRYIKDVLKRVENDSVSWTPIADHLRETYGFQPLLVDLFLCFLCQRDHRALQELDGDPVEIRIGMPQAIRIRLQRGKIVSAADWHRLRDLGNQLLDVPRPSALRSLQGQDRFAAELKKRGQEKRTVLQGLHTRLVHLGVDGGERLNEVATANTRLGVLAQTTPDSHKILAELLAAWPEETSDSIRSVVQQAEAIRDAIGELSDHARSNLKAGVQNPVIGTEALGHLSTLEGRLAAAQTEQPLTKDWVLTWNKKAQDLTQRLIEQPQPQAQPPFTGSPSSVPLPPPSARAVLLKARLNLGDADAVSSFLAQARKALSDQGRKSINVVLVREEDPE